MSVVLTREDFLPFKERMLKNGWEPVNKKQALEIMKQLEVVGPHHPEPGFEEGFTKFIHGKGCRVTVWTKYVEAHGETRERWDVGHTVMLMSNKVRYVSADVRVTPTFFERLEFQAKLVETRAKIRPCCKYCPNLLEIAWNNETHQHWWYCPGSELDKNHPKYTIGWDVGLPEPFASYVKKKRKETYKYNLKRDEQGKPHKNQGKQRKRWRRNN